MKKKSKFLWIYTGILFSFALILIIFAWLTQNNIYKETDKINNNVKGYKSSIEILTNENEKLKNEINELKATLNQQSSEKEKLENFYQIENSENPELVEKNNNQILEALKEYNNGNKIKAKDIIKDINVEEIGILQKYILDKINE